MEIFSEEDIVGIDTEHPWADQFEVLSFADGSVSCIPHQFFHDELDEDAPIGNLHIGRCAIIGAGSRIRYGSENQSLHIGRFVTIGNRLRVLLNGRCETRTLSTFAFSLIGQGLQNVSPPLAGDVMIKNDVWIGDDVTLMGGCVIEDGCVVEAGSVVPADYKTEPFGVYCGNPARLQHFRFNIETRRLLLELKWWDRPLEWIEKHSPLFLFDLNADTGGTLSALQELTQAYTSATSESRPNSLQTTATQTLLHVGCGPQYKNQTTQGFNTDAWSEVRLDIDPSVHPDVIGTMTDMSAVASSTVDAIFSSHNIEHLYPHEVPVALGEFVRVLNDDGYAVITCPDLQSVCALVTQDYLTEAAYISPAGPIAPLDIIYGHRTAMADGNLFMAHRCGFTRKVLAATLEAAGFKSVLTLARPQCFDLWAIASRSERSHEEMSKLAQAHFPH